MSKTVHTIEMLPSRGYGLPLDVPRKLVLRGMLVSDYQNVLFNLDAQNRYQIHKGAELLDNLVTDEKGNSVDLTKYYLPDIDYLLFELKKITFGIMHHQSFICPHCKTNMNVDVDTDKYVKVGFLPSIEELKQDLIEQSKKNSKKNIKEIEQNLVSEISEYDLVTKTFETENYKIKIKMLTVEENSKVLEDVEEEIKPIKNIDQKNKQRMVLNIIYSNAKHIVSVSKKIAKNQYEEVVFESDLFKYQFVQMMSYGDYKRIKDEIDAFYATIGVNKMDVTVECPVCEKESIGELNLYSDLFI